MGLDMYAFAVPAAQVGDQQVDVKLDSEDSRQELAYWRKFNHLHGWMEKLYRERGGKSEDFNCDTVRLMPEDLNRLENDLAAGLAHTPGFFFGGPDIYPEDVQATRDFIRLARNCIEDGMAVLYDSWW